MFSTPKIQREKWHCSTFSPVSTVQLKQRQLESRTWPCIRTFCKTTGHVAVYTVGPLMREEGKSQITSPHYHKNCFNLMDLCKGSQEPSQRIPPSTVGERTAYMREPTQSSALHSPMRDILPSSLSLRHQWGHWGWGGLCKVTGTIGLTLNNLISAH